MSPSHSIYIDTIRACAGTRMGVINSAASLGNGGISLRRVAETLKHKAGRLHLRIARLINRYNVSSFW